MSEFTDTLRLYRVSKVIGDRYAGQWPVEQFQRFSVRFEQAAKPKSELFIDLLPLLNSRRIQLLNHPKLAQQLCSLERRTSRSGRDIIDHPPGAHDDLANAVAGVASLCVQKRSINYAAWQDGTNEEEDVESWRRMRMNMYLASGGMVRI